LVWRDTGRATARRTALGAYLVQLALNLGWTGVFFGLERPGWALAEIAVLAVAVAVTAVLFSRLHRVAGWMLVPYLAWVLFAGSINAGVVALN
jgi:translocator protein